MKTISITPTELQKSAVQYLPQLLKMPIIAAQATLKHMTGRPGTRGRVVLGELDGDAEVGPYDPSRVDTADLTAKGRTLETYLGSVIKEFDPNSVWASVYGALTTQGEGLKDVNAAREVLSFLAAKLGKNLNKSIWNAVRNPNGTKTRDLFDGFDTITAAEISAGKISENKQNLFKFEEEITRDNAVDFLKQYYWASSDELQGQAVKMYIPFSVMHAYEECYQLTCGIVPYNNKYEKPILEGSNGLCELVPLSSKKGSQFLTLAPQSNLVYGYGDGLADEKISIEKYHAFFLQFVATMYFGVQFKTISPEMLNIGQLYKEATEGSEEGDGTVNGEWVDPSDQG
ncbi:MAG: hypothetical protein IKR91_06330 [Alloprevotella sp.]|nr:hypothetical protein [Alloprevotella sp.]